MFPDHVFAERAQLIREIGNAPLDFLQDNAAALMRITWELQQSLALELQIIQQIRRLDVSDAVVVEKFADQFADYVEQGGYNLQRTSCGRIEDLYRRQILVLEDAPGGARHVPELQQLLEHFAQADRQFADDIEPFMNASRETLDRIRADSSAGLTDSARRRQTEFAETYRAEVRQLKAAISEMNEAGRMLLERL